LSSDEEPGAQFSTVRNRRKPKKSINNGVKQSTNKNRSINKSQNHNQAKERIEQGLIQQVDSEAQSLGNEVTDESGSRYDQSSQNEREDLGERFKSNKKGKNNDVHFKIYKRGPFNIHLKVRRPNTLLVEGKQEKKWGQFDVLNVMAKSKTVSSPLDNMPGLFGKKPYQTEWKQIKLWTALSSKMKG
jgi:hypothetical protein